MNALAAFMLMGALFTLLILMAVDEGDRDGRD